MQANRFLLPDLVLIDGVLRSGHAVELGDDGTIASVGPPPAGAPTTRLPGRLLLPGFVNAHSHGFQRAIRGRSEYRRPGRESDDFWTWREQMYAAALRMRPEQVEAISRMAFMEMALAGITTVGEFHYLHHQEDGGRYDDPDELALRVVEAAKGAGIGLVLLRVGYGRAGYEKEADQRQRRFLDRSAEEIMGAVERLAAKGVAVGVAPHSVRALPLAWIRELAEFAREGGLPFHMHLSEQPREVEEAIAEHGQRPAALMLNEGLVDERFTGVHGVHLTIAEIDELGKRGANICACPTTERNLGDGVVRARDLLQAGVWISFGTDSQIEIAPLQDARSLEYHLRLLSLERAVLGSSEGGDPSAIARTLLDCATLAGARSLGLDAGRIAPGARADLLAIDLEDPSIAGADEESLLANVVFSLERTAIREVWSAGEQLVSDGRHRDQDTIVRGFQEAMGALWSA